MDNENSLVMFYILHEDTKTIFTCWLFPCAKCHL